MPSVRALHWLCVAPNGTADVLHQADSAVWTADALYSMRVVSTSLTPAFRQLLHTLQGVGLQVPVQPTQIKASTFALPLPLGYVPGSQGCAACMWFVSMRSLHVVSSER